MASPEEEFESTITAVTKSLSALNSVCEKHLHDAKSAQEFFESEQNTWASNIKSLSAGLSPEFSEIKDKLNTLIQKANTTWENDYANQKDYINNCLIRANGSLSAAESRLCAVEDNATDAGDEIDDVHQIIVTNIESSISLSEELAEDSCDRMNLVKESVVDKLDDILCVFDETGVAIEEILSDVKDEVDESLEEEIMLLGEDFDGRLAEIMKFISESIVDETKIIVTDEIVENIRNELEMLLVKFKEYLLEVAKEMSDGSDGAKKDKEQMQASTDVIQSAIQPLMSALESFKGLASTVGMM